MSGKLGFDGFELKTARGVPRYREEYEGETDVHETDSLVFQ